MILTIVIFALGEVEKPVLSNPFERNIPFLYLLKTSENLWFFDIFRGYKNGTLGKNGLTHFLPIFPVKSIFLSQFIPLF